MAFMIDKSSMIWKAPSTASILNQINMTGPNNFPIEAVPNCCIKKKTTTMPTTINTMVWLVIS